MLLVLDADAGDDADALLYAHPRDPVHVRAATRLKGLLLALDGATRALTGQPARIAALDARDGAPDGAPDGARAALRALPGALVATVWRADPTDGTLDDAQCLTLGDEAIERLAFPLGEPATWLPELRALRDARAPAASSRASSRASSSSPRLAPQCLDEYEASRLVDALDALAPRVLEPLAAASPRERFLLSLPDVTEANPPRSSATRAVLRRALCDAETRLVDELRRRQTAASSRSDDDDADDDAFAFAPFAPMVAFRDGACVASHVSPRDTRRVAGHLKTLDAADAPWTPLRILADDAAPKSVGAALATATRGTPDAPVRILVAARYGTTMTVHILTSTASASTRGAWTEGDPSAFPRGAAAAAAAAAAASALAAAMRVDAALAEERNASDNIFCPTKRVVADDAEKLAVVVDAPRGFARARGRAADVEDERAFWSLAASLRRRRRLRLRRDETPSSDPSSDPSSSSDPGSRASRVPGAAAVFARLAAARADAGEDATWATAAAGSDSRAAERRRGTTRARVRVGDASSRGISAVARVEGEDGSEGFVAIEGDVADAEVARAFEGWGARGAFG